jgi:transcriptional regulator with XRE-family HTH domain
MAFAVTSGAICGAIDGHVGSALARLRDQSGLSHTQVAAALEVSERDLARIEKGDLRASAVLLMQAARIFNVKPSAFYEGWGAPH